ncbi:MAG: MATE family efflux transporter, partial [Sarcina sp.]
MKQQKLLGEESIVKLLVKYSVPAIIGMLVNALYNIVDRAFIGRIPGVGQLAITGVGITMPIAYILLAFGMLIGIGTTANMSIKLGQGKKGEVEKLIGNSLILTIIVGLLITVLGLIFVNPMLRAFGASSETLIFAKEYIVIILLGSIFNLMSFALNSTIRADGSPKMAAA